MTESDRPFPPYAFIGGFFPHPTRDPAGHQYRQAKESIPPPDPNDWRSCPFYLRGIDLFNHGYYWEAHEAWESLWTASGRTGCVASFLKGLIALAAAGIKIRQGRQQGIRRHANRAIEHFQTVSAECEHAERRYMGLALTDLIAWAEQVAEHADELRGHPEWRVEVVFPFVLRPG